MKKKRLKMETAIKTTLAKKNSEMEKLEQSKKSNLRMITSSAAKLRLKYGKVENQENIESETEARKIRMYETHNPGFCYLRNGEYRKRSTNTNVSSNPDPVQCSEKIKAILFTENELDIYKTMCLHLLGTHIQNKSHIQRKDGRLCSYIKAQVCGKNAPSTLHPVALRLDTYSESPTKYDKMLPRYILDVRVLQSSISTTSVKPFELDSGSDEEAKKKRKLLVPIFINSEIRTIINSVMEALEAVESSKLNDLTELAKSPEELRDMLSKEDTQEFISELARNPLVMKPTSYDFVMAHLMFDKIPDKGTLETVAQVLEVFDNSGLNNSLQQIRRGILYRHLQLTNPNLIHRKKSCVTGKASVIENPWTSNNTISSRTPSLAVLSSGKTKEVQEDTKSNKKETRRESPNPVAEKEKTDSKRTLSIKSDSEKVSIEKSSVELDENSDDDESFQQRRGSADSTTKYYLHNLTNSQRILLGLKVASLKSRPLNMHQFEGKKKVDIAAIVNPIIRPQVSDIDYKQNSPENHLQNFALPERKSKNSSCKISTISTTDLENLTRALLANLRLQISHTENKKRVNQFMSKI